MMSRLQCWKMIKNLCFHMIFMRIWRFIEVVFNIFIEVILTMSRHSGLSNWTPHGPLRTLCGKLTNGMLKMIVFSIFEVFRICWKWDKMRKANHQWSFSHRSASFELRFCTVHPLTLEVHCANSQVWIRWFVWQSWKIQASLPSLYVKLGVWR